MPARIYDIVSGIYTITNTLDGKVYVGLATNFTQRKSQHFKQLKDNLHKNVYLQRAFNKYGEENFIFEVLEYYPDEGFILPSMENWWVNMLRSNEKEYGYNLKATNPYNRTKHTPEIIQKIKDGIKNKPEASQETRDKISKSNKGRIVSQETRNKIGKANSLALKGRVMPEETKQKLSIANTGKKKSKESIDKRLKTIANNPEIGKRKSEKLSKALTGKKLSKETIDKIRETKKRNRVLKLLKAIENAGL